MCTLKAAQIKFINDEKGMTEVSYTDSYKPTGGKGRFLEILWWQRKAGQEIYSEREDIDCINILLGTGGGWASKYKLGKKGNNQLTYISKIFGVCPYRHSLFISFCFWHNVLIHHTTVAKFTQRLISWRLIWNTHTHTIGRDFPWWCGG